ncbi:MAG: MarP family serine protease [Egibacteraceae bacterium]
MNVVDIILLGGLLYAAARGWWRGALSQVAAFGGAAVGLVVGAGAAPRLAALIVEQPGPTLALLTLGLLLGGIVMGQAIGVAIGYRLHRVMADAGAATVDRTAGIAVGVTALLLAVWLLGSVLVQGPSRAMAREVRESRIVATVGEVMPPPPDLFGRVGSYLDQQGFPQVFSGLGDGRVAPPVSSPSRGAVAAAQRAGTPSTVQVLGTGCGGVSSGSGFVSDPGFVVTNAHVVAGADRITVLSTQGEQRARPVHVDDDIDVAVLSVPNLDVPAIDWADQPGSRGTQGVTLGFPGGEQQMIAKPAAVRSRTEAVGRDIYGKGLVTREVLTLSAAVQRGDSGGPFVTRDGDVAGVVFAAAASDPGNGYALTAAQVRDDVAEAVRRNERTRTGACRF